MSTTVSGIPELVGHEESGLLTEPRNPRETADAVTRLLRDDDAHAAYSIRARETVADGFDIQKQVDRLERSFRAARLG